MEFPKKKLETLGGIGSILTGLMCTGIGVMDFGNGQSIWKVWVVMTVVLVLNGIAMLRHAAKRVEEDTAAGPLHRAARARP
jgi:hypothetical protein